MCRQLAASLRIPYRVGVAVCDRIAAPILVGVLRPMILLPTVALTGWDPPQLEMVLLHELAHVRRCDNLVNLLQRIVESVLFFHPMVWIVSGWVRREREHCCDELVVARTHQPHAYAEILVTLAETFSQSPLRSSSLVRPQAVSSFAERPLVARIRCIVKKEEQAMQVSSKTVGLVFVNVLILATLVVGYHSMSSNAEDSSAAADSRPIDTLFEARPRVPGDVIAGVVVDKRGKPQANADVWAVRSRWGKSVVKSGADGTFRLELQDPFVAWGTLIASTADGTNQGIVALSAASCLPIATTVGAQAEPHGRSVRCRLGRQSGRRRHGSDGGVGWPGGNGYDRPARQCSVTYSGRRRQCGTSRQ